MALHSAAKGKLISVIGDELSTLFDIPKKSLVGHLINRKIQGLSYDYF